MANSLLTEGGTEGLSLQDLAVHPHPALPAAGILLPHHQLPCCFCLTHVQIDSLNVRCPVSVCRLWEEKQGRVEKNKNEREYMGMKLLSLKIEGSGIVIWRVSAGIMLLSHWRMDLILDS